MLSFCPPRIALVCTLLAVCACGGASPTATTTTTPAAAAVTLPPIPDEPIALVPASAQLIARFDLERLRASPHFPSVERWLEHGACIDPKTSQWLTQRSARVALASFGGDDGKSPEWIAIAYGSYEAADVAQVTGTVFARQRERVPQKTARGRFGALLGNDYGFVQLDDRMLAFGANAPLSTLMDVADGKAQSWEHGDAALPSFDNRGWLLGHGIAGLGKLDANSAHRIADGLGDIGAGELGAGLEHSAVALALELTDRASANAQIAYVDPNRAEQTANGIRDVLDRTSFVLRLVGIPSSLTHPKLEVQASKLAIEVELAREDVESIAEKLEAFMPACGG